MRFRDDQRAAALQVGAILLLGFFVIGLALYQATIVPDQNEEVEFDHNQQVQESIQEVRNGILRTASAERTSPTTVPLGTRYPSRIVAVNPPSSSGRLATLSSGEVRLVNATAVNDETADYWNGTTRSRSTKQLTYTADYSRYQAAPVTVYDDTVVYNEFDGANRSVTDQRLLNGNLIYVVSVDGSLNRSGTQAVSVSPTPVSASDRTVAINGTDIAIEVTTDLPEDEWERLLEDQYESNGGRIAGNANGVTVSSGTLTIDLVSNKTYRLRMAKVGVGTGVSETTEQYLTVIDGADSVTTGGTRRIVLEVRDGYNNPVSGATVDASVDGTGSIPSDEQETVSDGDGRVVYEYDAPNSVAGSSRTDTLNFTFNTPADRPDFSGEKPESAQINVTVVSLQGDEGEPGPGPTGLPSVIIYESGSGNLQSVAPSGLYLKRYDNSRGITAVGPKQANFDGDGILEVPYVDDNNQDVLLADEDGEEQIIATNPGSVEQSFGVGDVDSDSRPEVVFVGNNNDILRQADIDDDGASSAVQAGGQDITAERVAGVGDFNGDGDDDIVFVGTNNTEIKYVDNSSVSSTGVSTKTGENAFGQPGDFDDDGELEVPYVRQKDEISYVDANGLDGSITLDGDEKAARVPIATITDQNDNGADDIAYLRPNGEMRWVDPLTGETKTVGVQATKDTGVS